MTWHERRNPDLCGELVIEHVRRATCHQERRLSTIGREVLNVDFDDPAQVAGFRAVVDHLIRAGAIALSMGADGGILVSLP